jgi:hypothetical protein
MPAKTPVRSTLVPLNLAMIATGAVPENPATRRESQRRIPVRSLPLKDRARDSFHARDEDLPSEKLRGRLVCGACGYGF